MGQFHYGARLGDRSEEIRILKLAWGEEGTDLQGRLLVRRLGVDTEQLGFESQVELNIDRPKDAAPKAEKYDALSYTWGYNLPDNKRISIAIGEEPAAKYRTFNIKENLEAALLLLRSTSNGQQARYLWVDALCINQDDKVEKSFQIPLMSKVYGSAQNVIVWLGKETDTSSCALKFVNDVLDLNGFDELSKPSMKGEDSEQLVRWSAFCELLKSPWFGRRWIVQEIALAKKARLCCGTEGVDWDDFADAVSLVSSRPENLRMLFKSSSKHNNHPNFLGDLEKLGACWLASTIASVFRKKHDRTIIEHMFSLEALMSNLTLFEAGDPRDYLYAILFLANDVFIKGGTFTHPRANFSRRSSVSEGTAGDQVLDPPPSSKQGVTSLTRHLEDTVPLSELPTTNGQPQIHKQPAQHTALSASVHLEHPPRESSPEKHRPHKRSYSHSSSMSMSQTSGIPGWALARKVHSRQTSSASTLQLPPQLGPMLPHEEGSLSPVQSKIQNGNLSPTSPPDAQQKETGVEPDTIITDQEIRYADPDLAIEVNYNKPVFEVCKDFMAHVFSRLGHIDMMCRPWAPNPSEKEDWNPPSWMMTLDKRIAFGLDEDMVYRRTGADPLVGTPQTSTSRRSYNASGPSRAFDRDRTGKNAISYYQPTFGPKAALLVKGFVLADVHFAATDSAADGNIPVGWLKQFEWKPNSGRPPPDDLWRTLVGDRGLDTISEPPRYFRMACDWAFKRGKATHNLNTSSILENGKCPSHVSEYIKRVQRVVWNRRLVLGKCPRAFPTDEFLLGLGPYEVRKGDKICILYGCSVPVILRYEDAKTLVEDEAPARRPVECKNQGTPKKNGFEVGPDEKWYNFIGECYVHNMMNGEVFSYMRERSEGDDPGDMEFEIR